MKLISIVNKSVGGRDLSFSTLGRNGDLLGSQHTLNVDQDLPVWPLCFCFGNDGINKYLLYTSTDETQAYLWKFGSATLPGIHPDLVWGIWPTATDQIVQAIIDDYRELKLTIFSHSE